MTYLIFILVVALAAANGANDVSKGVATLAGAGVTRYRTAILWGTATTLVGGLLSILVSTAMGDLFSAGIVSAQPTAAFALAVLAGTVSWVTFATIAKLPVSTTHAIVGSLIGAGLLFAPYAVMVSGIIMKVITPLLLSIVVAYGASMLLSLVLQAVARRRKAQPAEDEKSTGGTSTGNTSPGGTSTRSSVAVLTKTATRQGMTVRRLVSVLHWISSGMTGMARGLNDTPKIAAIGAFALVPAGMTTSQVALVVAVAMALGSLLGLRVARTLGDRVIKMGHGEGFQANAITSLLVGAGATLGWPMSTTHVSTGAIVGTAGTDFRRLNKKTIRDFVLAWTVTPVCAAHVAAGVYLLVR